MNLASGAGRQNRGTSQQRANVTGQNVTTVRHSQQYRSKRKKNKNADFRHNVSNEAMGDGGAGSTGEVVECDEGSIPEAADSSCTTTASEQPDTSSNVGECDTDFTSVPHYTNNTDLLRVALLKKELFQNRLRVTVGNTTVNGLIDTGASISVISCNFISKVKPSLVKYL